MTEFQIASAVKNYVTSHEGVTDFPASIEQIAAEVDTARMRFVSEMDRNRQLKRPYLGYTQSMTLNFGSSSVLSIPRIYTNSSGKPAIAYAGGTNRKSPFKIVHGDRLSTAEYDLFTHDYPTIWIGDGEARLVNDNANNVLLVAIFEDPSDLAAFGYDDETNTYPLPSSLVDMVIGKTAESYLRHMYRIFPQPNTQSDIPVSPQNVQRR